MVEVSVRLPAALCSLTGCERRVVVKGRTLGEALRDLVQQRPALALHLCDDTGALRRHVLCFRNEVQARDRAELEEALEPGEVITLVNSVSGG